MATDLTQQEHERLARMAGWRQGITHQTYVDGNGRPTGEEEDIPHWFRSKDGNCMWMYWVPHVTLDELFDLAEGIEGVAIEWMDGQWHVSYPQGAGWTHVSGDLRIALSKAILAAKGEAGG